MPALDFAVALGVVWRGAYVGHAAEADEFFEIAGDELGPVVGDDAGCGVRHVFSGSLEDEFHVDFGHGLAQAPVDDEAAVAFEHGAQVI